MPGGWSEEMPQIKHVRVGKMEAQEAIESLRKNMNLLREYPVTRDDTWIYIPVKEEFQSPDSVMLHRDEPRKIIPTGHAGGFDLIGEIAIIHLRNTGRIMDITEFILRVKPGIRTIYSDGGIRGELRLRDLELLYGPDDPTTIYRENGLRFNVNVKTAYFSPRLSTERYLLSRRIKNGERIFDMFAGIGSFSLNLAHESEIQVFACDINPAAYELMKSNISMNKLKGSIDPFNGDSYEKIKELGTFSRIVMNNPMIKYRDLEKILEYLDRDGILNIYYIETVEGIGSVMHDMESLGLIIQDKRIVHGYSKNMFMFSLEYRKVRK
jgi:tRNA (guanine37-N1)-methyltransferase